jgi:hypothetical protein
LRLSGLGDFNQLSEAFKFFDALRRDIPSSLGRFVAGSLRLPPEQVA